MVVLPEPGVQLQVMADVVHPAHVPLQEYIKKPVSILLEEESKPKSKESNEDVAMFEMQQRIKILEKEGGILSPS